MPTPPDAPYKLAQRAAEAATKRGTLRPGNLHNPLDHLSGHDRRHLRAAVKKVNEAKANLDAAKAQAVAETEATTPTPVPDV